MATTNGSPADNKEIVRKFLSEGLGNGDEDLLARLLAKNHVQLGPAHNQKFEGLNEAVRYAKRLTSAFQDLEITVDDMMAAGDQVVANATLRGTHTGDLILGDSAFEPTNRGAVWPATFICRVKDGKLVETRVGMDRVALMRQLGVRFEQAVPTVG